MLRQTCLPQILLGPLPRIFVANAISSINVVNAVLMLFQHRLNLNKPNHLQYFYVVFYSAYDPGITCSKSVIITLEKRGKYVQS